MQPLRHPMPWCWRRRFCSPSFALRDTASAVEPVLTGWKHQHANSLAPTTQRITVDGELADADSRTVHADLEADNHRVMQRSLLLCFFHLPADLSIREFFGMDVEIPLSGLQIRYVRVRDFGRSGGNGFGDVDHRAGILAHTGRTMKMRGRGLPGQAAGGHSPGELFGGCVQGNVARTLGGAVVRRHLTRSLQISREFQCLSKNGAPGHDGDYREGAEEIILADRYHCASSQKVYCRLPLNSRERIGFRSRHPLSRHHQGTVTERGERRTSENPQRWVRSRPRQDRAEMGRTMSTGRKLRVSAAFGPMSGCSRYRDDRFTDLWLGFQMYNSSVQISPKSAFSVKRPFGALGSDFRSRPFRDDRCDAPFGSRLCIRRLEGIRTNGMSSGSPK
ncbi:hypothetical protein SS05631_b50930 (plasmid) [Sinorhizobium sp. CCBAU 05631]|nr:hypothetical protein SS05631_b50930 [Sinorhizobium sp. CCBAU 05631]